MEERTLRTLHPTLVREDLISPEQQLRWITRQLRELRKANAALTARVTDMRWMFANCHSLTASTRSCLRSKNLPV